LEILDNSRCTLGRKPHISVYLARAEEVETSVQREGSVEKSETATKAKTSAQSY
jgi:hypothetical protein